MPGLMCSCSLLFVVIEAAIAFCNWAIPFASMSNGSMVVLVGNVVVGGVTSAVGKVIGVVVDGGAAAVGKVIGVVVDGGAACSLLCKPEPARPLT